MEEIIEFNKNVLDAETREYIDARANEIRHAMRRTAQDIVFIGSVLADVKSRIGHGNFVGWIEDEFGMAERMAQRFMNVATRFKPDKLSDLTIAPSALYLLAAPSTPDEAVDEALERAEAGESITHSAAKEIVDGYKPVADQDETEDARPDLAAWNRKAGEIHSVADPNLSWYENYGQIVAAHPNERMFMVVPGPDRKIWVALDETAQFVAAALGKAAAPILINDEARYAIKLWIDYEAGGRDRLEKYVGAVDYYLEGDEGLRETVKKLYWVTLPETFSSSGNTRHLSSKPSTPARNPNGPTPPTREGEGAAFNFDTGETTSTPGFFEQDYQDVDERTPTQIANQTTASWLPELIALYIEAESQEIDLEAQAEIRRMKTTLQTVFAMAHDPGEAGPELPELAVDITKKPSGMTVWNLIETMLQVSGYLDDAWDYVRLRTTEPYEQAIVASLRTPILLAIGMVVEKFARLLHRDTDALEIQEAIHAAQTPADLDGLELRIKYMHIHDDTVDSYLNGLRDLLATKRSELEGVQA